MTNSPLLEKLVMQFSRFPGIGRKTAQRLAWFLLSEDKASAYEFADVIKEAADSFTVCSQCLMLAESDPCPICLDSDRDDGQLCIVETTPEIFLIENMQEYHGKYFVLGHLLSPLEGYGTEDLHTAELLKLIENRKPSEIILALKPSAEGEATIHYIYELLKDKDITLTRLSTGIPFGGDLEYTSTLTLTNAWKRRYKV
ncbi:MAG TPA: recombination mediator RecR [Candidatus Cloacimonadota bacterium]|nr:recombination mediator RecR [Candidatus Cloacimonadota bacterium]